MLKEEAIIGGTQTTWIVDSQNKKKTKKKKKRTLLNRKMQQFRKAMISFSFLSSFSLGLLFSLSSRGKNKGKGGWFDGHSFRILCIIHFSRFTARRLFGKLGAYLSPHWLSLTSLLSPIIIALLLLSHHTCPLNFVFLRLYISLLEE